MSLSREVRLFRVCMVFSNIWKVVCYRACSSYVFNFVLTQYFVLTWYFYCHAYIWFTASYTVFQSIFCYQTQVQLLAAQKAIFWEANVNRKERCFNQKSWQSGKKVHSCLKTNAKDSAQLWQFFGLHRWLSGKESTCSAGDAGSIPGMGRFPREGNGNPLQYSFLENLMDRGAWWATVHGVLKESESDTTEQLNWTELNLKFFKWIQPQRKNKKNNPGWCI